MESHNSPEGEVCVDADSLVGKLGQYGDCCVVQAVAIVSIYGVVTSATQVLRQAIFQLLDCDSGAHAGVVKVWQIFPVLC